ncbi:hypothetical protein ACFL3C_02375 [Patescibacteria group bacterium]
MDHLKEQIKNIDAIMKRHGRYTHFSGIACIFAGVLWLTNTVAHDYLSLTENYRVVSWIVVALVSVIAATFLTVIEAHKRGKEPVTLSLIAIIDKLLVVALATLVLMWIFYKNELIIEIPSLLMLMYGILMLASKQIVTQAIKYFGYITLIAGVVGLLFIEYSVLLAAIVLGGGHIVLGIILIINGRKSS